MLLDSMQTERTAKLNGMTPRMDHGALPMACSAIPPDQIVTVAVEAAPINDTTNGIVTAAAAVQPLFSGPRRHIVIRFPMASYVT
jgi:hypothetical protein